MKIQSVSIVVPGKCPNKCKFCVAHMKEDTYTNHIEKNKRFRDLYKSQYKQRLMYARNEGCNIAMLTGNGEPLTNLRFIEDFFEWNANIPSPFRWIELQTSGVLLNDETLRFLRNATNGIGVSTISLSLSSLNSWDNNSINGILPNLRFDISKLCESIKLYDFNLRLSLNMTKHMERAVLSYGKPDCGQFFKFLKENLKADQVTIRQLYSDDSDSPESNWVKENSASPETIAAINDYVKKHGRALEILPFGATRYSLNGMSIVVDNDCMNTEVKEEMKYLVLQPNCKFYTRWDDEGSLLF